MLHRTCSKLNNFKLNLGITLIELTIVLSIIGILISISISSYQKSILKNDMEDLTKNILNALNLAKTLSITQSKPIILCGSKNQINCTEKFNDGFIMFYDKGNFQPLSEDIILKSINNSSTTLSFKGALGINNKIRVTKNGITYNKGSFILKNKFSSQKITINHNLRYYLKDAD